MFLGKKHGHKRVAENDQEALKTKYINTRYTDCCTLFHVVDMLRLQSGCRVRKVYGGRVEI